MRNKLLLLIAVVAVIVSGCSITRPIAVTSNSISYQKYELPNGKVETMPLHGKAIQYGYLFFPPLDSEAGIWKAAANAQITKIATVDYKIKSYILFYSVETIVTGEK